MNLENPVQLRNIRRHLRADAWRAHSATRGILNTNHVSRFTFRALVAFTLIELLTVIAIIGILAALTTSTVLHFRKGDAMLSATRMMLDGVAYARQLALSQHTTVMMVFVPPEFWDNTYYPNQIAFNKLSPYPSELAKTTNILEKQLTGFTFVSLRSIGDQPGASTTRYLTEWRSLPEKSFIPLWKFTLLPGSAHYVPNPPDAVSGQSFPVRAFSVTNVIPFPSEDAPYINPSVRPYISLPYIAFDYQGRLVTADGTPLGRDEFIPLAHGGVAVATDQNKNPIRVAPSIVEQPPGNSTNTSYNLIHIDWLTGRARLEHQQVQ
jgi:prepilin-type N-terminal cleavage/methylation domain-containing protein